ncbi:MAG: tetratricopeptide repeat protein [Desulfatiglandales bacterium]
MKKKTTCNRDVLLLAVLLPILLAFGCVSIPQEPLLDSTGHHVESGFKLMEKGRLDDAEREFKFVCQFDPKCSSGQRGLGLVKGIKGEYGPAFEAMGLAEMHAATEQEAVLAHEGFIRLFTMSKDKGWLEAAEKHFILARPISRNYPDIYYYMGMAYEEGGRFIEAEMAFRKVLEINRHFVSESYEHLKVLNKLVKAAPESELGKALALSKGITRAQVAGLFVRELKLDEIFPELWRENARGSFGESGGPGPFQRPLPEDIMEHALRQDIEKVLLMNIRELHLRPDGSFGPDEYVRRAEYAVMVADIMVRVRNEPSLTTQYAGAPSPFMDISNQAPYFGAVMLCMKSEGLLESDYGFFRPRGRLTGADALTSIERLRALFRLFFLHGE